MNRLNEVEMLLEQIILNLTEAGQVNAGQVNARGASWEESATPVTGWLQPLEWDALKDAQTALGLLRANAERSDFQPLLPRDRRMFLRRVGGARLRDLAAEFGVSIPHASRIVSRERKRVEALRGDAK